MNKFFLLAVQLFNLFVIGFIAVVFFPPSKGGDAKLWTLAVGFSFLYNLLSFIIIHRLLLKRNVSYVPVGMFVAALICGSYKLDFIIEVVIFVYALVYAAISINYVFKKTKY